MEDSDLSLRYSRQLTIDWNRTDISHPESTVLLPFADSIFNFETSQQIHLTIRPIDAKVYPDDSTVLRSLCCTFSEKQFRRMWTCMAWSHPL
ncbi:hypothetical protein ABKN59_011419 [Abortiporus biennis]